MEPQQTPSLNTQALRQSLEAHSQAEGSDASPLSFYIPALDQNFQLIPSYDGVDLHLEAEPGDTLGWFCGLTPAQYSGLQGLAIQILGWIRPALVTEQHDLITEFSELAESLLGDLAARRFRWEPFIAKLERLAERHSGPASGLLLHAKRLQSLPPA